MKANARIFSSCNFLACALVAGAAALAAPPEEDPQVNAINRLPARTYSMPLVPHDATFLNLDLRQSGFGDFNKNVMPLDKYRFDAKRETWTVELAPEK